MTIALGRTSTDFERNNRVSLLLVETKEKHEAKAAAADNETEAGEVPDAPRALHRTLSIFFRHLATQTTKEEIETVGS